VDAGLRALLVTCTAALLGGCAQLSYYAHLARGQMELLGKREPIEAIVGDPTRDAELRRRLAQVLEARRFAVSALHLPDNASYTLYADLDRPYVVWNVFATREFSLAPVESCFPISGCVAYRGHYSKARAQAFAAGLEREGYDVDIGGVPAYSTLGWFDDPVLNTMMHWSDAVLVGTVFHELAHQQLYVKGDTAFNESYARFVEQEGLRQYFRAGEIDASESAIARRREAQFVQLVLQTRRELAALYALPLSPEAMRTRKAAAFEQLRENYRRLRESEWNGARDYEGWFSKPLNNASLLPVGLYDEFTPAFGVLFEQVQRDWPRFHAACRELGELDERMRRERLTQLQGAVAAPGS
jgi:predicted aminopeptidase